MAGMQPFALCGKIAAAYCALLAAGGCPSSQIAIVAPSAVPLWKVIVGPRADELQPDPQGSGFSLGPPTAHACAAAGSVLLCYTGKREEGDQWPGQPRPSLRSASAWRSTAICRPSSEPAHLRRS